MKDTLETRLDRLGRELRDLAFMEREGYIADGAKRGMGRAQLRATIRCAQEAFEDVRACQETRVVKAITDLDLVFNHSGYLREEKK